MRLLLLTIITSCTFTLCSLGQSTGADSLCCNCFKTNYEELDKIEGFKALIKDVVPNYVQHTRSLSENIDLIQYEKFNYLLKLDKHLKFELNKKMYALEDLKDSSSRASRLELEYLNEVLRRKTELLNYKVSECEKLEIIQRYSSKKNLINSLDPDYYNNFINLLNSTIDQNRLDYAKLIELDRKLLEKLELKKRTLNARPKKTSGDSLNLVLLEELLLENGERIKKLESDQTSVKIPEERLPETKAEVPEIYFLKEIIMSSDTIHFSFNKPNEKQVIVANNTMYIFRNDSLIETIKNEDNSEIASVFDNRKPVSVDNYDGFFYTIQIGTYSKELSTKELKVKSNLFYKKLPNGNIRYSFGMFNNMEEVERAKKLLESIGITDMFVIAYYQKEKITLRQARKFEPKGGD